MKNSTTFFFLLIVALLACSPVMAQFNPTAAAKGFSVFTSGDITFKQGIVRGAIAAGGNVVLDGQGDVCEATTGLYPYGAGNANNFGIVAGDKMVLTSGTYGNLKKGFLRMGNTTGVNVIYKDCYNNSQYRNLVVTNNNISTSNACNAALSAAPRWELQVKQTELVTSAHGIDFAAAFTELKNASAEMAKYVSGGPGTSNMHFMQVYYNTEWEKNHNVNPRVKIEAGKVNVFNITGAQLQSFQHLFFDNNTISATTPLVINVNTSGNTTFSWIANNFYNLTQANGAYIVYNFYNHTGTINISGGAAINGSILAPNSTINDAHNNMVAGQVIAKNYTMSNWSSVGTNNYSTQLPEAIEALNPPVATTEGAVITHNSFTAVWKGVAGVVKYKLEVSKSANFAAGLELPNFSNIEVTGTSQTVTGLEENTEYFYRVRSLNGLLNSDNSNVVSVITNFNPTTTIFRTKTSGKLSGSATWQYNLKRTEFRDTSAHPLFTNKIKVAAGHKLIVDVDHTVATEGTFEIENGAEVEIEAGKGFSVDGTANFNNQPVTFKSTADGTARMGEIRGTLQGATNVAVERYINAGRKWRLLTAPIDGTTIHNAWQEGKTWNGVSTNPATFTGTLITGQQQGNAANANKNGFDFWSAIGNSSSSIKAFTKSEGSAGNWTIMPNTNGNFDGVKGYMLFVRGDRSFSTGTSNAYTVLSAKGLLKDSYKNVSSSITGGGINLVGNPFASVIDFDKFYAANSGAIAKQFIMWDATLNVYGGFRYVVGSPSSNNYETLPADMDDMSTSTDYRFIESGTAFFVTPLASPTTKTITFAQSHKTISKPSRLVFRDGNGQDEQLWINLNLLNSSNNTTLLADGVKAKFGKSYSATIDANDLAKTANMYENLSIVRNSTDLAIEARQLVETIDTIHLKLSATTARNYQFQIKGGNFAESGLSAFLIDAFLNTTTPIDLSGAITNINFAVTSNPASTGGNRFKIVLKANETLPVQLTSVKAYRKQATVAVEWNVATESNIAQYEVERSADARSFTKAGTVTAKNQGATTYTFTDATPVNGNNYYRLKIISNNGPVKYSEVVAVKIASSQSDIAVYPNPVTNNVIGLQLNNLQKDRYTMQLINAGGQQVYSQIINHQGGSAAQNITMSKQAAPGVYQLILKGAQATYNFTVLVK